MTQLVGLVGNVAMQAKRGDHARDLPVISEKAPLHGQLFLGM